MRILLLDANVHYLNPTRNLLPPLLRDLGEVVCFGPGYQDLETLRVGLGSFVRRNGPFDVAVATEHVTAPHLRSREELYLSYRRNYAGRFPIEALACRDEIYDSFCAFDGIKIATLLETDYYNRPQLQIDTIEKSCAHVVGWGQEFLVSLENTRQEHREIFLGKANDNWLNFIERNPSRIISLPHFIGNTEVDWRPLSSRPAAWSVVGAKYAARVAARKYLSAAGISWRGRRLSLLQSVLGMLRIGLHNKRLGITLLNHFFREAVAESRYAYTCGSALRYPVRKYFEIPALGSVLVCEPCAGFEALGFRDGENAIVCPPEDILDVHRDLEANPEKAQAIASAGRQLVLEAHTVTARARQLGGCLDAITDGAFGGSMWERGGLNVLPRRSSAVA